MFGDTPLVYVDTPDALAEAARNLAEAPVIGVDTEADSFHHYQEKVCLVQISDLHCDYVIDPLAVPDLSPLAPLMANPAQVKIFHGADYDVVSMKRDFGFTFRNLFDTMLGAQFAGLPRVGLADLIKQWFGHVIDKKYQRHDWAERPLLDEHLDYARGDTHFLPALRDVLKVRLSRLGRLDFLMEECQILEAREWAGRARDPSDFYRVKGARQLDDASLRALRALWGYREQAAAAMDRPVFKVIPEEVLFDLARTRPATYDDLANLLRKGSGLLRRHGAAMVEVIAAAANDDSELPQPPSKEPRGDGGGALRGREQERLMLAFRDWRNQVIAERGLPSVAVVSNNILKEVARRAPRTVEELTEVPEIRRWQVQTWGETLVGIVNESLPQRSVEEPEAAKSKRRRRRRPRSDGEPSAAE